MSLKIILSNQSLTSRNKIESIIKNFNSIDDYIAKGNRNSIKKITLESGKVATIKSFKIPNIVNKFVYRFFRKSKAQRSFEYAKKLIDLGFKTPAPIAYVENRSPFIFLDSYYICELLEDVLTYRQIMEDPNYPNKAEVLKQFTKFTFDLHEAGIEFLDHSSGNTLIEKINENEYAFYLVDLNRMNFHENMNFETRMKNFSRLSPLKGTVEIMAKEYAELIHKPANEVIDAMWNKTEEFQHKFHTRQSRKKKLKALVAK